MSNTKAVTDILAERVRQIKKENFDYQHDDQHVNGELAVAAACYATPHRIYFKEDYADSVRFVDPWPFDSASDHRPYEGNVVRSNGAKGEIVRRSLLVKAAALILAEIERMDRASLKT